MENVHQKRNVELVKCQEMFDISLIEKYNEEFKNVYPDWKPFVTRETFYSYLSELEKDKEEIFYWAIENNKIIGSGSLRIGLQNDDVYKYSGNIFYQIVPSLRKKGYGTLLCHLLLQKMSDLGFEEAMITCYDWNIGSQKIINNNYGDYIETINGDGSINGKNEKTKRYHINIKKSLKKFKSNE